MRRTRGEANQSFYRARIILSAWERERKAAGHSEAHILGAFLPAVKMHLREAYGWFLLSVSGVEQSGLSMPPKSTGDLALPEAGRARPPELHEFEALEATGWLGELLSDEDRVAVSKPSEGLLGSDRRQPGLAVAQTWYDALGQIMVRMDDSLAEC